MQEENSTRRARQRNREDESFLPVIIKRNDQATRHPDDILERAIHEGIDQHRKSNFSLFLSAVAAGLILGFAAMCVALATQLVPADKYGELVNRLALAIVYPLGFIICVMSGTQLFTEQTATAVYPVLDRKASKRSLLKLWSLVLAGNFVGSFVSSFLLFIADDVITASEGFIQIADHLTHFSAPQIFISAILAGWLMAQGGWLIMSTPPASSQVICIYIVTFIIGLGGLHHSIVGSAEIISGILHSPTPNYLGSIKFIISAVLGNLTGGVVFVGILNYGHIRKTQK